jgi:hypothetical protein
MQITTHTVDNKKIAEVSSTDLIISSPEDALDLLGNLYYQGFDHIVIREENITTDFFDLKTGIAGEILQKFSNYRVRLAVIGDFSKYTSKSLKDFLYESNKGGQITFVRTLEEALVALAK